MDIPEFNQKRQFELRHSFFENFSNRFIHYKNFIIFKSYNGYLGEHNKNKKVEHYGDLWRRRAIYNSKITGGSNEGLQQN